MKTIPLTNGKVALVDDEDFEELSKYKWYYNLKNKSVCASGGIPMSHIILQTNKWVDHKDGNKLDFQRSNLRICTNSQNQQNKRKQKKKVSSKYKGVYFFRKKWKTEISFRDIFGQRAHIYLGSFHIEEEAAKTYDTAARKYFGEFAALNFPNEGERSCLS